MCKAITFLLAITEIREIRKMATEFKSKVQSEIAEYLTVPAFQDKWESDQQKGAGYFYALSYPFILEFFRQHKPLFEALELNVALIFSWNPTICNLSKDRFMEARENLKLLDNTIGEILRNQNIGNVDIKKSINELWYPIKKVTCQVDSTPSVSVTKFLHFSFPEIFPMIDTKVMRKLGGKSVSLEWYYIFLMAWQNIYLSNKKDFDNISKTVEMPLAR